MTVFLRLAAILLVLFSSVGVHRAQQIVWPVMEDHFYELGRNPGFVPRGNDLKPFLLGFDNFVADLFWLRAVQYAGGHAGVFEFEALPEYLELVTDLDPHFEFAYIFGALVLPLSQDTLDDVPTLLRKGIIANEKNNPQMLPELYINLGFYTYFYLNQYDEAAEIYETCAREIDGCPPFADKVAAFLRAKAGRFEIALNIWLERLLKNGGEGSEQEDEVALRKVEESAKMAAIDCAAGHYFEKNGSYPGVLTDLIGVGTLPCQAFASLQSQQLGLLEKLDNNWNLERISSSTLTSSFTYNPFVWDTETNRLKTQSW